LSENDFGAILDSKSSNKGTKNETQNGTHALHHWGSKDSQNNQNTKVVQSAQQLEIYTAKERDVYIYIYIYI
jgi:ribosomal protein L35